MPTLPNFDPLRSDRLVYLIVVLLLCMAFMHFRTGYRCATVRGKGWEAERAQVDLWLVQLHRKGKNDGVREILERTFIKGKLTYRFLNAGDCWAMAAFGTGNEDKLPVEYRVRGLGVISLMEEPGGGIQARVDGHAIPKGCLSSARTE
ncbi:MAG: hypothetical protein WAO35_01435 [Terriglobia bacterium]